MEATPLTAADVGAVVDGRRDNGYGYGDGFGFGGAWIWVILLFVIFGYGNGWNRNNSGLTQSELQNGFNTQSLLRGQEGIRTGLSEGFFTQNTALLQGQNALQRDLCQGFGATTAAIAENRYAAQNCCCETKQEIAQVNYDTNRNIDASRYESAKNTCDIITAINADGEKTRAVLVQNKIDAMQDKIAEQSQMLQTANFQLSQQAQSANIINTLRPVPIPAYPTCSPYQAANYYGLNGCGNFA